MEGEGKMNAKDFFKQFKNAVKEKNVVEKGRLKKFPDVSGNFDEIYKTNEPAFTELINKDIIDGVIANCDVDEALLKEKKCLREYSKLVAQHEYFRIDSIGYQHKFWMIDSDDSKNYGLNRHFWDLKIAVEHENSKKDWMDEVIKLIHVRCPLKVVIAYNYCDHRDYIKNDNLCDLNKLNYIAKWMVKVNAFDKNAREEYLVIIGNGAGLEQKSYSEFDYRGYIFDYATDEFIQLDK